jgi:hypothetical protein
MEPEDKQAIMNTLDPLNVLGIYFDDPVEWDEDPFESPERGRIEDQMGALQDFERANVAQMQLRHALQRQMGAAPAADDARQASRILDALSTGQIQAFERGAGAIGAEEQRARDALARVLWDQKQLAAAEASGRAARIRGAKTYDRNFQADNLAKQLQSGSVLGVALADAFGDRGEIDLGGITPNMANEGRPAAPAQRPSSYGVRDGYQVHLPDGGIDL